MHSSIILLGLAALASARTDLSGCVSSLTKDQYGDASVLYYVPSSGEICAFLDCGGGRAPPITTQPGCAAYQGTATYSPSFLPGFKAQETGVSSSQSVSTPLTTKTTSTMVITAAASTATMTTTSTSEPADSASTESAAGAVVSSSVGVSSEGMSSQVTIVENSSSKAPAPPASTSIVSTTVAAVRNGTAVTTSGPPTTSAPAANNAGPSVSIQGMSGLIGVVAAGFAFFL